MIGQRLIPLWSLALCGLAATPPAPTLEEGYRLMYNLQFDDAHRVFAAWEQQHPEDAVGPASDGAAYLFAEFDRLSILQAEFFTDDDRFLKRSKLLPDPVVKQQFDRTLERGAKLAEKTLLSSPRDKNALFALVLCRGLRSDYAGLVEKRYMASLAEMKRGRKYAEALLTAEPSYYDAYVALGVENYMLSLKPAPLRWIMRMGGAQTDREQGLKQLRLAAKGGRFLAPFARLLLAVAALRDKDRQSAKRILGELASQFPRNHLYAEEFARLNQPGPTEKRPSRP